MRRPRRIRYRDILRWRWRTVSEFYWRLVNKIEMRVCRKCEKEHDNDPARANRFYSLRDGDSRWLQCAGCGQMEREG